MGIFDFLKRKPGKKPENFGHQRVVDTNVKPTKTKPAEMPKPPKGNGGIPKARTVATTPAESAARRQRRDWERDEDRWYDNGGYIENITSPLSDADFDGTPNIVDNTPYGGSETYCAPQTESSSSWTSESSSSACYDSGNSSSSYDSGSSSSYDSGSSDSGSSW